MKARKKENQDVPDPHDKVAIKRFIQQRLKEPYKYCGRYPKFYGYHPLIIAILTNDEVAVKNSLSLGADAFFASGNNKSALQLALSCKYVSDGVIKLLLENLCKKLGSRKKTADKLIKENCHLYQAALLKDSWIVEYMLKRKVPVDTKRRGNKCTALHVATALDDIKTVRILAQYGANLQALDRDHANALHYLYKFNMEHNPEKVEILEFLLKRGVSATSCIKNGNLQIKPTVINGDSRAIGTLLQSQVDFTVTDQETHKTLLHYIAWNTNSGLINILKQHVQKFDINATSLLDTTPVYEACTAGNFEFLEFLLDNNAKPDCVNFYDKSTPFYQVYSMSKPGSEQQYNECAKLLLQYHANAQFIIPKRHNQVTIFDVALGKRRTKPIIAHLALLEYIGCSISEITDLKIISNPFMEKYFDRCQGMLQKEVAGAITIFDLLTANEKKMTQYVRRESSLRKLKHIPFKKKLKKNFSFYYKSMKKRISKVTQKLKFEATAREFVCKIFKNQISSCHLLVDKVIKYLDDKSLKSLHEATRLE